MAVNINIVGQFDPKEIENAQRALERLRDKSNEASASMVEKLSGVADRMGDIGMALTTKVTLPIVGAFGAAFAANERQQQAEARLQAVLGATGGVAGVTADHVKELASNLQQVTTFGDEATIEAASLALTFKSLSNEAGEGNNVFDRTLIAAQDMSALFGQDLNSSVMQLGKALEDPIAGLGALRRVGVSFSEAQREQIKEMVEAGDVMGAQKMILDELEKQVGGTAQAMAQTAGGQMKQAFNDLGDAAEQIGAILAPMVARAAEFLKDLADRFQNLSPRAKELIVQVGALAAAIGPVLLVLSKLIKAGLTVFTTAVKVGKGLATLGVRFVALGKAVAKNVVAFARWAAQTAVHAAKATAAVVKAVAVQVAQWVKLGAKAMLGAAKVALAWLIAMGPIALIVAAVVALVVLIVKNFDTIKEVIGKAWEWIKATIERLWKGAVDAVSKGIAAVVDFFKKLPGRIAGAAGDLFRFLRDRMTAAKDWVWNRIQDVFGFYRSLPGRLASAAGDVFGFLRTKMTEARDWVANRISDVVSGFTGMPGRIRSALSGLGSALTAPFRSAFNSIAGYWNRTLGRVSFTVPDWVPGVGGRGWQFPKMPTALAQGGIVTGPTLAMIGDNMSGKEAVIPLERAGEFGFGGGSGTTYNITVNALDPASASRAVVDAIRQYERRNGSGWRR
jgi:phage-related protein